MPTSTGVFISSALVEIERMRPESVLDAGCGFGLWGFLSRLYLDVFDGRRYKEDWQVRIEGVEVFPKYIMPHQEFLYDRTHIGSIEKLIDELDGFDLYIFGDVLEHLPKQVGVRVLATAYQKANKGILVNIPLGEGWLRDGTDENPHEAHLSMWDFDDFIDYCPRICGEATFPDVGRYGAFMVDKTLTRPEKTRQMFSNGQFYVERNVEFATECFRRAIEMGHENPDAYLELANLSLQERNVDDAIAVLREAVTRFPDRGETHDTLGKVLLVLNRPDEAREVLAGKPSPPAAG